MSGQVGRMSSAKILLFGLFSVALSNVVHCQDLDCDSSHIDECGAQIFPFLLDPNQTPSNEQELEANCQSLRKGEQCSRDYLARCPNKINPTIADGVLDSLKQTINDICTGNLGKRLLQPQNGKCMRENLAKNFPCNQEAIQLFEGAAVFEPVADRIKHTCCSYLSLDKCYSETVTAACGKPAARLMRNMMQSYAIFMVEKCLPHLAEPEKCNVGALKGSQPRNGRKMKSFLPAMIDVAEAAF